MSDNDDKSTKVPTKFGKLLLGRYHWRFGWGRLIISALCISGIWWALSVEHSTFSQLIIILSPLLLGITWGPTPEPKDHANQASVAVDELAEMHRANTVLQEQIAQSDQCHSVGTAPLLVQISIELEKQRRQILRIINRWSIVSPGIEDEIVSGKETNESILRKLEGGTNEI